MRFIRKCRFFVLATLMLSLLLQLPVRPVEAAGLSTTAKGWIRARIDYSYDSGITRLNDKRITFSAGWGAKQEDGWYYYGYPVKSGDSVTFIEGVTFPTTWTKAVQNKEFSITVTIEVTEMTAANADGWNSNTAACYSCTFPFFSSSGTGETTASLQSGRLKISVNEYEVDENGIWSEYENDQMITPGQFVSKIVVIAMQRTLVRPTGDNMTLFLYGGAFLAAAGGMVFIFCRAKKAAQGGGDGT